MKDKKYHNPEQIIRKLEKAALRLATGQGIAQTCQALEISEARLHRWRHQYGGMKAQEAKSLKEIGKREPQIKKMVADLMLDKEMLKSIASGNF